MKAKAYKNLVGENLRSIRKERALTQEGLALMSGLSQGYINQLESGKRKFTQKTLTAIAEALGIPLIVFFSEENIQPVIREKTAAYTPAGKPKAGEVVRLLRALPPRVAEHYLTLMSLEKTLYEKKRPA